MRNLSNQQLNPPNTKRIIYPKRILDERGQNEKPFGQPLYNQHENRKSRRDLKTFKQ